MAKRLNKKVALIGTAVFLVMFVVALIVVQEKDILTSRAKLIEDGDVAMAKQDYETAKIKYLRARSRAEDDRVRLVALHKLVDLYLETEDWPPLNGVWREILTIEPDNLAVRYAQLKFLYIVADSGTVRLWQDIEKETSDFLEIIERDGLLNEDTAKWEKPQYEKVGLVHTALSGADGVQRIGQYLYLLRGRAKLEMASRGAVTDPDKILEEAIQDLKKAQELDPTNTSVAWQLARAFIAKGDMLASRGSFEERDKAKQLALEILEKAVDDSPQDAQGRINLLALKQSISMSEKETLENLATFEPQYRKLVEQFPLEPAVYSFVAAYYRNMGPHYLDQAIEAVDKARELEPNNVLYAISAADSYNIKAAMENDKSALDKAISILDNALELPGVQETKGPQQNHHRTNRASVYMYLGTVYLERLLDPSIVLTPEQKQEWLDKTEDVVHEIEQIVGSGEDPTVMKWQGMLALAKGDKTEAVQKLYAVYQQLKASNRVDTQLAYALAKTFENSSELGAAGEFYMTALRFRAGDRDRSNSIDRRKPSAVLDLAQIMLKLQAPRPALTAVNYFESLYGANSRSHVLKIDALSAAGNFEDAEEALAEGGIDPSERLQLEAQLLQRKINAAQIKLGRQRVAEDTNISGETPEVTQEPVDVNQLEKQVRADNDHLAQLITELLSADPNSVSDSLVLSVCRTYKDQDKENEARALANLYLRAFPTNILIRNYLKVLDIGGTPSEEQLVEIHRQLLEEISDPCERAFALGLFCAQRDEPNEAEVQFRKVLEAFEAKAEGLAENDKLVNWGRVAGNFIFERALLKEQWDSAEKLVAAARQYNLDRYQGDFFRARLDTEKGEYELALQEIERCAKQNPVSSQVLALRGQIKESLGRTNEAIADMKQAAYFNPLNSEISRILAIALYKRNVALGDNVTTDQFLEAKEAIERAIADNRFNVQLLSFYAEFISDSDPQSALAIRQRLFRASPSVENATLLGNMAFKVAEGKTDENEKQALMEIASESYQEALKLDPSDQAALASYAKFCRATGRPSEAEKIISDSQDENLQWRYYISTRQYDKAKVVMDRLYATEPENEQLLVGFLRIAEETFNQDDAKYYSEALCKVDDSIRNNLYQIQVYLTVGLISEAQLKLESFREKHPDEPRGQLLSASLLMRQGKLDEALELANKSLETDQTNANGWLLRGQINGFLGNSNQAISDLMKSKSFDDNAEVRMALARSYLAANRAKDAVTELVTIVDDPATPDRARVLLESIYKLSGNNNLLGSFYSKMISQYPDNMMWTMKAAAFSEQLKNYETAQRLYLHAWDTGVEQGRPDIAALDAYIMSLIRDDKLQQALDVCAKYVDSEFASVALVNMGIAKAKLNDQAAAVEHFRMAADREQDNPFLMSGILRVMYEFLGPDEVQKYCTEKLAENPDSFVVNYVLYYVAWDAGNYNNAIGFIDKCIAVSKPDSKDYINSLVEKGGLLALAYDKYSDNSYIEQAVATWQQLLEKLPDNANVLNNIAYLLAKDEEKLPMALQYAEKAIGLSPDNPSIQDTYAYVLYKNSRFEEAAENARAALQQYETQQTYAPSDVYEHLGMIMEALGRNDEAVGAYKKALEAGKDSLSEDSKERINKAVEKLSR
jgi:tetratricopeptide (TPR) repeat protein